MADIKFPPIFEVLRRRFQADTQPTLADQIVPVVALENDRPEYRFNEGVMLCSGKLTTTQTNSANWLQHQLYNPTGSDVLIVLETLWGHLAIHDLSVEYNIGIVPLRRSSVVLASHTPTLNVRDTRWDATTVAGSRYGMGQLRTASAAVDADPQIAFANAQAWTRAVLATIDNDMAYNFPHFRPFVLAPGSGVHLTAQGVAGAGVISTHHSCWMWTERPMSAWERASIPTG